MNNEQRGYYRSRKRLRRGREQTNEGKSRGRRRFYFFFSQKKNQWDQHGADSPFILKCVSRDFPRYISSLYLTQRRRKHQYSISENDKGGRVCAVYQYSLSTDVFYVQHKTCLRCLRFRQKWWANKTFMSPSVMKDKAQNISDLWKDWFTVLWSCGDVKVHFSLHLYSLLL